MYDLQYLWSTNLAMFLVIDICIAILFLFAMRFAFGLSAKINTQEELAEKDNFAFGISLTGAVIGLGIVMSGAITGETAATWQQEVVGMVAYGLTGLILIKLGRFVFDKIALNQICRATYIAKQNMAVGWVDAAAAITTALIVRAILIWVEGLTIQVIAAVIIGFIFSQLMMILMTRIREWLFHRHDPKNSLQQALKAGNQAVAVRFSGHLISTGLVITAASNFVSYSTNLWWQSLVLWILVALVLSIILKALVLLTKKIVLWNIRMRHEVDKEANVGVAGVEFGLNLGIALILTALMA